MLPTGSNVDGSYSGGDSLSGGAAMGQKNTAGCEFSARVRPTRMGISAGKEFES